MTQKRQPYDSSLKSLLQEDPERLLPRLLPGAVYIEALDVEVLPPAMRSDRVFVVELYDQRCIVDIEFESSADPDIERRLHAYAANLNLKYHLMVVSMVVYPFKVTMPKSPLQWQLGPRQLLNFEYQVVALWQMQAHQYVQEHAIEMYPLLPTMQGVTIELLGQALNEMSNAYQDDEARLARQLLWMGVLLRRSSTIAAETKLEIRRRLDMFDRLLEEDERVLELMEEREARGRIEGEILGKVNILTAVIETRFPTFAEEAHNKLLRVKQPEEIDKFARFVVTAPDENALRWALDLLVA